MLAFLFIFINGIHFSFATKQRTGQIEFRRTVMWRPGRSFEPKASIGPWWDWYHWDSFITVCNCNTEMWSSKLGQVTRTLRFNLEPITLRRWQWCWWHKDFKLNFLSPTELISNTDANSGKIVSVSTSVSLMPSLIMEPRGTVIMTVVHCYQVSYLLAASMVPLKFFEGPWRSRSDTISWTESEHRCYGPYGDIVLWSLYRKGMLSITFQFWLFLVEINYFALVSKKERIHIFLQRTEFD